MFLQSVCDHFQFIHQLIIESLFVKQWAGAGWTVEPGASTLLLCVSP